MTRKTEVCQYYHKDAIRETFPDSRSALRLRRYWWTLKRNVWHASVLGIFRFGSKAFAATEPGRMVSKKRKKTTPAANRKRDSSGLKTGDWVEVRSVKEIFSSLDAQGKLNGLSFTSEMLNYCGKRFKIYKNLDKIILEATGELRKIKTPTVLLEGVICDGTAHGQCDKSCFLFWRENWLKKVPSSNNENSWNNVEAAPHPTPMIARNDNAKTSNT